jgi:hypothetical protein
MEILAKMGIDVGEDVLEAGAIGVVGSGGQWSISLADHTVAMGMVLRLTEIAQFTGSGTYRSHLAVAPARCQRVDADR